MRFHWSGAVAATVLLGLGAAGCGSSSSSSSPATTVAPAAGGSPTTAAPSGTTAAAAAGTITIQSFNFKPNPATAKVGDTLTISNQDSTAHTFTADDGSFDTKAIDAGSKATVKLTKAGTISYHCNIHQFMKGTITVSG
jgi:plastocyanin